MRACLHRVCWSLGGLLGLGAASTVLADPALITPGPRELELLGKPVFLEAGRILLVGSDPKLGIAAGEINDRIVRELQAEPLPVISGNVAEAEATSGPVIAIGVAGTREMAPFIDRFPVTVPDHRQGYGISVHRQGVSPVVVMAGHDAQGALYAAVTARYLLDPAVGSAIPDGQAALQPARVQDWPDFPWRQIGRPPANVGIGWQLMSASRKGDAAIGKIGERFVQEETQYVDFLLRHKINLSWTHATHLESSGQWQYPYLRQVSEYAKARGVHFVEKAHSFIGTHPKDKDDPVRSRCVDHRVHKQYFCWSLLDLHEERARHMARAMKASGIHWLYLHATDGGGWENPARWNERCDECRRMYGDDHAKADAAVFGLWHRVMKEEMPDFRLIAVVYPYNGSIIDPEELQRRLLDASGAVPNASALARKIAAEHRAFLTRLGQLLPADVVICQRETTRDRYALMSECYGERDFQIYLELKHGRGWNPEVSLAPAWLGTFFRPGHDDVFYASDCAWGLNYLTEMLSAQFGWNVESPGAREFDQPGLRSSDIDHHIEPREISRAYLERFCRDFYGPDIGPHMVSVYDSNISYRYIQRPQVLISQMGIRDPEARMQQMVDATERAWAALADARQAYVAAEAAGRRPIPDELAADMFGEMVRAVLVSRHVAAYQLRMLQARPAVIVGDMDSAKRLVAEMRQIIAEGRRSWEEHWPWMRSIPIAERRNPNWVYTFGQFQQYDFGVLKEEANAFEKDMDRLFDAYNTPPWFKKAMQERALYAVPADTPPMVDGRLDEVLWTDASPNEFFVNHRTSTPAERETQAQIAYDESSLYIAYTVVEPGADQIPVQPEEGDDHQWNQGNSVELFVDANADGETYVHYIWGIDGTTLDGRKRRTPEGMLKMDNAGFESSGEFAVARYGDRWTLEARLPIEELGGKPRAGQPWRANLCRNLVRSDGKRESASTVLMEGSSFHTPGKFAELRFLRSVPPPQAPVANFQVEALKAAPCTIGDGTGFELELDVGLDTTKPLHSASLVAQVYSGNTRKGEFVILEDATIPLMWRSREPIRHLVRTPEPGLHVDFCLTAVEGSWTFRRKFGAPVPRVLPAAFVEGVSGQALDGVAWFPAITEAGSLFDSRSGALEMWVKAAPPLDSELVFGPTPQHVLFSQSPLRFDHPLLDNTRSVCLRRVETRLTGRVSTKAFQSVWTEGAIAGWGRPGWHHVAMQWEARNGDDLRLDIFVDGKRASRDVSSCMHDRAWNKANEQFVVQLGAMVSGAGALGWPIDEVRVSSAPRYTENFEPTRRAELDDLTTTLFHLDGDLAGQTPSGVPVSAHAGPGI